MNTFQNVRSPSFTLWSANVNSNIRMIFERLVERKNSVIRRLATRKSEQRRMHRTLHNPKVTVGGLVTEARTHLAEIASTAKHVLFIQDTSDYVFHRLDGNSELGFVNNVARGYRAHVCLALDAESAFPLGISSLSLFNRPTGNSKLLRSKKSKVSLLQKTDTHYSTHFRAIKFLIGVGQ
jgi:hypothetical protein